MITITIYVLLASADVIFVIVTIRTVLLIIASAPVRGKQ